MKMQTFRKPHQWLNFWLEKYTEVLAGLKYGTEQRKFLWSTLKLFLEELPGNPRNLPVDSVKSFIDADPVNRLLPVTIFFQHIAHSRPHLDMLKTYNEGKNGDSVANFSDDPVERFRVTISTKTFSDNTIKNYCSAVSAFIRWLDEGSAIDRSGGRIEEYCTYLLKEKQLSPRTVSLHSAALKLFFQNIIVTNTPDSTS